MSSTSRGYNRHKSDYYITPIHNILEFLKEFQKVEPSFYREDAVILDPTAGGDAINPMSYPTALIDFGFRAAQVKTIDIRDDSPAEVAADYLQTKIDYEPFIIITNPPFFLAKEIIQKALNDTMDGGYVIMLLRLNFFGSKDRKSFFDKQMPKYSFVHHRRMSFTNDGNTDSIEYQHCVWQKGHYPSFTKLKVI